MARAWRDARDFRWSGFIYLGIVATTLALFAGGAHFAATALIESQRNAQLQDLTETALRRSEIAVDYGIAALDELGSRGP